MGSPLAPKPEPYLPLATQNLHPFAVASWSFPMIYHDLCIQEDLFNVKIQTQLSTNKQEKPLNLSVHHINTNVLLI